MKVYYKSSRKNFDATAEYDGETITILKGSKIVDIVTFPKFSKEADSYRSDPKCVSKDYYTLKDITFKSLSTAAQFVSGISVNGYLAWKNSDKKSIKELKK